LSNTLHPSSRMAGPSAPSKYAPCSVKMRCVPFSCVPFSVGSSSTVGLRGGEAIAIESHGVGEDDGLIGANIEVDCVVLARAAIEVEPRVLTSTDAEVCLEAFDVGLFTLREPSAFFRWIGEGSKDALRRSGIAAFDDKGVVLNGWIRHALLLIFLFQMFGYMG
jgi:hypothetical protein